MNLPVVIRKREAWDPFRDLWGLQREMNRVFSDFSRGGLFPSWDDGRTSGIPLEMHETDEDIVVRADLPGLEAKDIDVSVMGTELAIKAERRQEREMKSEEAYCRELTYGAFERRVDLPQEVKADGITANYKNGVLELRLPKQEGAKRKLIKVDVK